jgi:hypothetical protein
MGTLDKVVTVQDVIIIVVLFSIIKDILVALFDKWSK